MLLIRRKTNMMCMLVALLILSNSDVFIPPHPSYLQPQISESWMESSRVIRCYKMEHSLLDWRLRNWEILTYLLLISNIQHRGNTKLTWREMEVGVFDRYFYWKSSAFFNNLILFPWKKTFGISVPWTNDIESGYLITVRYRSWRNSCFLILVSLLSCYKTL